ncbi:TonB-dependent receptor [Fulvivirga kasyanovii]|uniref:TonB-dependent receptor n=2 Tax=Fulvivirga kasyanovii TaxID=396812 RepID=A0ABW9RYP6_9BACT|nr:TonB-dependent receptor [Fulvivirga kasyanovii]
MLLLRTCLLLLLMGSVFLLHAQKPKQQVSGYVFDQISRQPVEGVEVYLKDTDPLLGTATDEQGAFAIESVPVGRYVLVISHIGYDRRYIDLVVEGGKPAYIEMELAPAYNELEAVTVSSQPFIADVDAVGKRSISIEQTTRFAANYLDPARVMISFPGVVPQNDQNNNIIINGKSPNGLLWRVEGLDVLNPNHLSNAGTLSDRPTPNGGGVNVLSTQMLGETGFITAPFGAQYGNVMSGVMDMNFRSGDKQENRYTAQASLIGLDLAAEGPLKQGKSSFLINYRYSTVGLLSQLGVDFGGEEINYQDAAFHVSFDQKKGGRLSVFGYGGKSKNEFEGIDDPGEWEIDKDSTAVDYSSATGAFGFKEILSIGQRSSLSLGTAFSAFQNERTSRGLTREGTGIDAENFETESYQLSSNAEFASSLGHTRLVTGITANYATHEIFAEEMFTGRGTLMDESADGLLFQPYILANTLLAPKWTTQIGLRYMYYTFNNSTSWLPSVVVNYNITSQGTISLNYSHQARLQNPEVYFSSDNKRLEMSKLHHIGLGYNHIFTKSLLTTQLFYERLYDIPVSAARQSSFSLINHLNDYILEPLNNQGSGEIYGLNLSYEKPMNNGFYYIASGSLFESAYEGSDGVERDSRFNNNYTFSFTAGKEYTKEKSAEAVKVTGLNGRIFYAGGLRATPISEPMSQANGETILEDNRAFSEQLGDYFRMDFRVSFKKEKAGYSRMFAIDIQNMLSVENDGFRYYDFRKKKAEIKKQLGIIPVLVYKVEF